MLASLRSASYHNKRRADGSGHPRLRGKWARLNQPLLPCRVNAAQHGPAAGAPTDTHAAQFGTSRGTETSSRSVATRHADLNLRKWIEANGGHIHASLRLVDATPTLPCRGVIAVDAVDVEAAASAPLIVVPERLYLSTDVAQEMLAAASSKGLGLGLGLFQKPLPTVVQLALLLAVERAKGADSFYAPYVASLPADIPCGWALQQGQQLDAALDQLRRQGLPEAVRGEWVQQAGTARAGVLRWAERAVKQYGGRLPARVLEEDVVWAMGQVLSRSWGRDPHVGLAPYIDLCNHRYGGPSPDGHVDEQGVSYACISSSLHGEPLALAAGDEVFVSYSQCANPLQSFLNLGFVPPEAMRLVRGGGGGERPGGGWQQQ